MSLSDSYKILGLKPGAEDTAIKKAFRKLAKKYHPDRNPSPDAAKKFQEITDAYEILLKHRPIPYERDPGYARAEEILRRERQKAHQRTERKRREQKEAEERFRKSPLYDMLLLLHYAGRALLILIAIAGVITPVILAIVIDPAALAGTFFFIIIGSFLLWHIYTKRETWFKLGKPNTTWKKLVSYMKKPVAKPSSDRCCYIPNSQADGKPYRIKLIRIKEITVRSFGALDHQASIKQSSTMLVIPRSARAEYIHNICSTLKFLIISLSLFLVPLTSILWRFIAGVLAGITVCYLVQKIAGVKAKTSYLLTPALVIKIVIWLLVMVSISEFGPGIDVELNEYKFIVLAGLIFLLDMLFDLLLGLLPFYQKLFRPLIRQGKILTKLYSEGFQNNIDYPVYSIFFPLFRWIF